MSDAPSFLSIGHRGARGHAPENTLLGLETGIRHGAQMVEFDVRRHPSGALMLLHDERVDRTTNGHGLFEAMDFDALRALDAGADQQIPTLEEALELVEQRVDVNIELKGTNGIAETVIEVLRRYMERGWPAQRFLVSSFHLPELWEFKQAAPDIPVAALVAGVPLDWSAAAVELGAVALNVDAEFADPRLVTDAHAHGLRIYAYTVNEPEDMQRLRARGVDGVFTDFPERARQLEAGADARGATHGA